MVLERLCRQPSRLILLLIYLYCAFVVIEFSSSKQEKEPNQPKTPIEVIRQRASEVWERCQERPPPEAPQLKRAHEALTVSKKMSDFLMNTYLKEALTHIVHLPELRLLWCIMPKVASTSWAHALLAASGYSRKKLMATPKPAQVLLREEYEAVQPKHLNTTLEQTTKFLLVRHPMERVVSAYRNKLEDSYKSHDSGYFYRTYGRDIAIKYRKDHHAVTKREPTFGEFVDYIVDTEVWKFDEHWRPMWLQCHVCEFHYDFVVKYENLKEEQTALEDEFKKNKNLPKSFRGLGAENNGGTNSSMVQSYLRQLSKDQLVALHLKYENDFHLFGYPMPPEVVNPQQKT
ncbi:carbohydrate sulfotransferase 11-like [Oratosquilla oratoria]|uniref:carbohydrate sulfotransferase 11-like n=1 Tax=Oratosquilla oratoria TaxID=337810 RepID=UPI003F75F919